MYASAQYARAGYGDLGGLGMGALVLVWPVGLATMMNYMHGQRKSASTRSLLVLDSEADLSGCRVYRRTSKGQEARVDVNMTQCEDV